MPSFAGGCPTLVNDVDTMPSLTKLLTEMFNTVDGPPKPMLGLILPKLRSVPAPAMTPAVELRTIELVPRVSVLPLAIEI